MAQAGPNYTGRAYVINYLIPNIQIDPKSNCLVVDFLITTAYFVFPSRYVMSSQLAPQEDIKCNLLLFLYLIENKRIKLINKWHIFLISQRDLL